MLSVSSTPARVTTRSRRKMVVALGATAAMVAGMVLAFVAPANAAPPAAKTVVSLTFDDAHASQQFAFDTMKQYGMLGTFYMNSGFIGANGFLTLDQAKAIAAYGNEIGTHTVSHPDLATVSADEASRQMCNDRVNWSAWDIPTTNFAYPFASSTTATETLAKNCGNNSARGLGDIKTRFSPTVTQLASAMPVPAAELYYTKAPDQVETTWTLDDLKLSVTQAEAAGGWVQLTFHDICDVGTCPDPNISPAIFQQFVSWLAPRASRGTVVERVQDVIGGATSAPVAGPVAPEAAPGVNGIKNPSLETVVTTGLPQCFAAAGYGSNTPAWQVVTDAHTGTSAVQQVMSNYVDGTARLMPTLDLGECAPTVTAGKSYNLSAWYKSDVSTQYDLYYRTALGTWAYWTSSPYFAASNDYVEATYATPAVPAGATAISFGLNMLANGTMTVDDFSMIDGSSPAPAALRAATAFSALLAPTAAESDNPTIDSDPKAKGDVVTEHYEIPEQAPAPVVPSIQEPGKTFVISPELTRG